MNTKVMLLFLLTMSSLVYAQQMPTEAERLQIGKTINAFQAAVNNKSYGALSFLVSPKVPELLAELRSQVSRTKKYSFSYDLFGDSLEVSDTDKQVKITGRYALSEVGKSISGLSAYFVLEKEGNRWVITDTNFHKDVSRWFWIVMIIGVLAVFAFWLSMIVDCAKHDMNNKTMWILLLVLCNLTAAIIYYFVVKRGRPKTKQA